MIGTTPAVRPSTQPPRHPRAKRHHQRIPFTAEELQYIRSHASQSIGEIARALGRAHRSVLCAARRIGVAPAATPRVAKPAYDLSQGAAERAEVAVAIRVEIVARCKAAGIAMTHLDRPIPLKTLAYYLVTQTSWRPLTAHIAADLNLDDWFTPRRPKPTRTQPGTPERVEVYAARVAAGEAIWCEGDAGADARLRHG